MSASGSVTPKAWESSWRRFLPIVSARAAVSPESLLDWAERAPACLFGHLSLFHLLLGGGVRRDPGGGGVFP